MPIDGGCVSLLSMECALRCSCLVSKVEFQMSKQSTGVTRGQFRINHIAVGLESHADQARKGSEKIYEDVAWVEDFSYRERLNRLALFSLECQRLRGDLIKVYKIMRGMDR
eukprot:g26117.t1